MTKITYLICTAFADCCVLSSPCIIGRQISQCAMHEQAVEKRHYEQRQLRAAAQKEAAKSTSSPEPAGAQRYGDADIPHRASSILLCAHV